MCTCSGAEKNRVFCVYGVRPISFVDAICAWDILFFFSLFRCRCCFTLRMDAASILQHTHHRANGWAFVHSLQAFIALNCEHFVWCNMIFHCAGPIKRILWRCGECQGNRESSIQYTYIYISECGFSPFEFLVIFGERVSVFKLIFDAVVSDFN